jgi:zinc finger protein
VVVALDAQGETRMLLTVIPYFREVIVVSFRCEHCGSSSLSHSLFPPLPLNSSFTLPTGHHNNEIQSAGAIQPLGSVYTVKITTRSDLDRQLVKSEHCLISIPEYQLQIPAGKGQFTTVEGVIADTIRDLEHDQVLRKIQHPDVWAGIDALVQKLRLIVPDTDGEEYKEAGESGALTTNSAAKADLPMPVFTIKLDDPSGNSFIETRGGGLNDPKWSKREYGRDKAQDEALGLAHDENANKNTSHYPEEVLSFPGICSLCGSELETLMKTVNIPHFKVRLPSPFVVCPVFTRFSLHRTSSSCRPTATTAVTATTRLRPVVRSRTRDGGRF